MGPLKVLLMVKMIFYIQCASAMLFSVYNLLFTPYSFIPL